MNCACFQEAAAPQVSHSLAERKGGKQNVADLNTKIKFSLKIPPLEGVSGL